MAQDTGPGGTTAQPTDVAGITDLVLSHIAQHLTVDTITTAVANGIITGANALLDGLIKGGAALGSEAGKFLETAEKPVLPIFGGFVAPVLRGLFDSDVGEDAFKDRGSAGGRNDAAAALVNAFFDAIERDASAPSEPSMEGSRRLATVAVHAAIEGWFNAFIGENLAEIIPWDWLRIKELTRLPEEVINALGIGRLVRSAILPLVQATAVEPMRWAANKKYRPTKLGASTVAHQLARGRWTPEQAHEELAREGYTDDRIDAILNEASKALSAADVDLLVRVGTWSRDQALQELRNGGWDELQAPDLFDLERHRRHDAIDNEIAQAAVTAYADGRIEKIHLDELLPSDTFSPDRLLDFQNLALVKRALRRIDLSAAEAEACVLAEIIPLADYRAVLERSGRTPFAVDALEMLLRKKLDAKLTTAQVKQQQADAKTAAAKVKADVAAAKKADVAAAAAVKQLGSPAELARAVVRGLVPIARLEQVLSAHFSADTVAIYVADVEAQRQDYLARQQHAADAAKRAAAKGLTTGELQTALVDGVLTVDQVRTQLTGKGLGPADVDVLLATMQDAAATHAAAIALHTKATQKAKTKPLSLADAEQLVRAGHWTEAQFNGYLATLGYADAETAALDQLLADKIAKDQNARAIHTATTAANPAKGLTLAQERRGVILGTQTIEQFQSWLVANNFTADAIATLVAEAQDAVAAAAAARAKRATVAGALDGRAVSLADLTRAAQLSLLTPADYQTQLLARGFSPEAAALEMDLLVTEMAAKKTPAPAPGSPEALLAAAGGAPLTAATARHVTIDGELAAKGLSLAETEAAVKAGLMTLDSFESWLTANGYGGADAQLLRALLAMKLGAPGG